MKGSNTNATAATTTTVGRANALACKRYRSSVNAGIIANPQLDELSGLAMSRRNPGVVWTHNDSGDSARIFAITPTGQYLTTIDLNNTKVLDVEDIAVSSEAPDQVWVADIGDNFEFRSEVELYHFPEPASDTSHSVDVQRVAVKYRKPGTTDQTYAIDAESFFVDRLGNGYIIEKTRNQQKAWVFQISADQMRQGSAIAVPILQIVGNSNGQGYGPTAADLSADGTTLAIKNYSETFIWRFSADSSIPAVLAKQPTAPCVVAAGLGEAITFDGSDLLTVEEGVGKPIRRTNAIG